MHIKKYPEVIDPGILKELRQETTKESLRRTQTVIR